VLLADAQIPQICTCYVQCHNARAVGLNQAVQVPALALRY
jgi:hypothetical protein